LWLVARGAQATPTHQVARGLQALQAGLFPTPPASLPSEHNTSEASEPESSPPALMQPLVTARVVGGPGGGANAELGGDASERQQWLLCGGGSPARRSGEVAHLNAQQLDEVCSCGGRALALEDVLYVPCPVLRPYTFMLVVLAISTSRAAPLCMHARRARHHYASTYGARRADSRACAQEVRLLKQVAAVRHAEVLDRERQLQQLSEQVPLNPKPPKPATQQLSEQVPLQHLVFRV